MRLDLRSLVVASLLALAGCSGSSTRSVSGQISVASYRSAGRVFDNPVVIARSTQHRAFVTHVAANGTFQLTIPAGATYRLTLANSMPGGTYHALSRIAWPTSTGAARWARVGTGGAIQLRAIHPTSVAAQAGGGLSAADDGSQGQSNDQGENDDDQGEDDGEVDCNTGDEDQSQCDDQDQNDDVQGDEDGPDEDQNDDMQDGEKSTCSAPDGGTTNPNPNPNPNPGSPCQVNADCASGMVCVQSSCVTTIL
jgi:hypothetical protein